MTLNLDSIFRQVDELHSQMIEWRRDFHQYPEIGFEEERTSKIVANLLKDWGIEVKTNVAKTGVVGLIEGRGEGNKTVALRADMDALPMQEENEVSYKSKVDGRMHACGHDGHTAMLLGAAKVLSSNREYINGNVKLIFQPAEEGPGTGGALPMIKEGVLDDVDAIFGLHLSTTIPTGQLGINMGPGMASTDVFEITMIGKGGHAGYPHEAVDAIAMGIRVFTEIQYMVSRHVDPMEPLVVSIGTFKGGFVSNVVISKGNILDTIIHSAAELLNKMSLYASGIGMLIFQTILNFFIPSGSGQAATAMPIMVPLADIIGMKRQIAVLIFQFGDGFSNLLWPTSFVLLACAIGKVPVNKYYKWFVPLFLITFVIQVVFIFIAISIGYGPF